jgi:hypothetical protein
MAKRPTGTTQPSPPETTRRGSKHKFGLGTMVQLVAGPMERSAAKGTYKVTALLPSDGAEFSYRIKSVSEPHERVARESQLSR